MMATDLLRAYLEWQADVGSDEVILPHPLRNSRGSAGAPEPSGTPTVQAHSAPGQESRHPVFQADYPGSDGIAQDGALSPLLQSLSHALEEAAGSGPERIKAPAKAPRPSEAMHFPVFQTLADYWEYLDAFPQVLQAGEDATAGRKVVRATGPSAAPLAMVGMEPTDEDAAAGKAFQGGPGQLLEKMMKAIRMNIGDLYLSNLVKIRVPGKAWSRRELARLVPLLHIELGLAQTPITVLLGEACAQTVLKTGKPLEELRQETHLIEGRKFVVTYHPDDLLRKEDLKRKAWEDLQWLQRRMAEAGAAA
jgi:uracil-DNA glycosylase family 4